MLRIKTASDRIISVSNFFAVWPPCVPRDLRGWPLHDSTPTPFLQTVRLVAATIPFAHPLLSPASLSLPHGAGFRTLLVIHPISPESLPYSPIPRPQHQRLATPACATSPSTGPRSLCLPLPDSASVQTAQPCLASDERISQQRA